MKLINCIRICIRINQINTNQSNSTLLTCESNVADDLNVSNYVTKIKAMSEAGRSRVELKKLLDIICQVPGLPNSDDPAVTKQLDELWGSIKHIDEMATKNTTEIQTLKIQNADLLKKTCPYTQK